MKDLVQEGRTIQETFKTNVVTEVSFPKTKEEVEEILKKLGINGYKINADLTVDVEGNVDINRKGLTKLPVKFGKVSGDFLCDENNLTSLQGAPKKVGRDFWCSNNQLTSLQGAPQKVGRAFWCNNNKLTSLQGAPQKVGSFFWCSNNPLTSLQGAPKQVGGRFYCHNTSLPDSEKEWAKKNIKAERIEFYGIGKRMRY